MRHDVHVTTYHVTTYRVGKRSKEWINADLNEFASRNGGHLDSIRWYDDTICKSYAEAEAFVKSHDKGRYDNLAVRYEDRYELRRLVMRIDELKAQLKVEPGNKARASELAELIQKLPETMAIPPEINWYVKIEFHC